jgi:L-threonylcarbamoyladenylate synthase
MVNRMINENEKGALKNAVRVIRSGGIVAFPTDTVYGIGVYAFNPASIVKLFTVKGRDSGKAIAVLLSDLSQLPLVCTSIPDYATKLGEKFWPGALTLVLPKDPSVPDILSPLPTIGVRIPDHTFARSLIRACGPLAVTSANISGQQSATTAEEIMEQLGSLVDLIIDGGKSQGGIPSTVVDCTGPTYKILRSGAINDDQLRIAIS